MLRLELINRIAPPPEVNLAGLHPAVISWSGLTGREKRLPPQNLANNLLPRARKSSWLRRTLTGPRQSTSFRYGVIGLDCRWLPVSQEATPGAVTYDAIQSAVSRKMDIVLVDTAGRLHTRYNLMEELKKVHRVSGKALPGAPHATWLVLDATTGQNALQQARAFKEAVKVDGIILAKLDSSAKGGMAFAIQQELGLPILFAGLGEKPEDLQQFDREAFVDGILASK